jgi:hypothetical protein
MSSLRNALWTSVDILQKLPMNVKPPTSFSNRCSQGNGISAFAFFFGKWNNALVWISA